ncbi:MAG: ribonuclease III [Bacillota bacterium]
MAENPREEPFSPAPLGELAAAIGFPVDRLSLLATALTHRSFAHETKSISNERLEFLGDAVLGLVVGEYLYHRFPQAREGEMAKTRALVVSERILAARARALDLGRFLRLGRGEEASGGRARESILADAFEAVVGALFIAAGLDRTRAFVLGQLEKEIEEAICGRSFFDFKTLLQEELQEEGEKPHYEVTREEGPDHGKEFTVVVYAYGRPLGQGHGRSKKEAEQAAAQEALLRLGRYPFHRA